MKQKMAEMVQIPEGISCEFSDNVMKCKKGSVEVSRKISVSNISIEVIGNQIKIESDAGNKNQLKIIKSLAAHMRNLFQGASEKYVYKLQACNVHFPMTLKVEGKKLMINNFLGEKTPRTADILPGVDVEVKGVMITVTSNDKEAAGHTAANFEKATKIKNRDRRVFQDGIFLIEKNGRAI